MDLKTIRAKTGIHSQTNTRISQAIAAVVLHIKKGGLTNRLKVLFLNREKDCYNCPFINGCLYGSTNEDVKQIKKEARKVVQGSTISNPEFNREIKVSRNGINEWTNQPHIHYAEKNRMILHIDEVLKKAKYLGPGADKNDESITIHLFETSIQGDKTWIIVKEYTDGNVILYSISDSANILKSLKKMKKPQVTAGTTIQHRQGTFLPQIYTFIFK